MEIFNDFFDWGAGFFVLSKVGHVLVGITWIGLLYFFNFVQVPSFALMDPSARNETIQKLTTRALWWFRWAALLTVLTGLVMLGMGSSGTTEYVYGLDTAPGVAIFTGALFGIIMFLNVWGVIWPNQKIVIANAERVLGGGAADPDAAAAGRKAFLASRTNTFFSITMLWFMLFTSHNSWIGPIHNTAIYWVLVIALAAVFELIGLGIIGGTAEGTHNLHLKSVQNVIIAGFVLWAVVYFVGWELILSEV